jgi:hypothetical protein
MKRVRAAKRGAIMTSVTPHHETEFYLPNHKEYFPEMAQRERERQRRQGSVLSNEESIMKNTMNTEISVPRINLK